MRTENVRGVVDKSLLSNLRRALSRTGKYVDLDMAAHTIYEDRVRRGESGTAEEDMDLAEKRAEAAFLRAYELQQEILRQYHEERERKGSQPVEVTM